MRPVVLLALAPLLMVASCTTLSKSAGSKDGTKEMPASARPEDVAQVDAFFSNGGKHGFHPPAEKTPDFTPADTQFVVELDQQRVYLYHQGELIAASRISSGRRGYRTETGRYTIGQKNLNHRSNLYGSYVTTGGRTVAGDVKAGYDPQPEGARFVGSLMKYFQRFERNGSPTAMGFHQGVVPNYPASHGCIRLPANMAAWFYTNVDKGTPVQINGDKNGVKPGTRQAGGRRAPRKFIPAAKPDDSAPAAGTTAAEAEGATAPPPAESAPAKPTPPAPTDGSTAPAAADPVPPSAPAPSEPAANAAPPPAAG